MQKKWIMGFFPTFFGTIANFLENCGKKLENFVKRRHFNV
jgi:hypothetical protein